MSLSSKRDKWIAKKESDAARNKLKSSKPEQYNNPVRDTIRTQGKGDNYRDIPGWFSDEITERLKKIYGKKETD
jgi:hypothetical protein